MKTTNEHYQNIYIDETGEYGQVVRWKSNDSVPPKDILVDLCVAGYISTETLYDSIATKNKEDAEFLEQYVARRQKYGYSDEEKAEMANAFAGETVIDVFTGEEVNYA